MQKTPYLKFLVESQKIYAQLSEHEKHVLHQIFLRDPKQPYCVQDILEMKTIASPATLHKALKNLTELDYLTLNSSKENGRTKFVVVTKKANKLLEKLNALLRA